MPKSLILIDGSSLIYRAFYALPMLTTSSGQHTNAVYGFTTMLLKLLADLKPDAVVVALDKAKVTFRNQLYAGYKAQRKAMPTELAEQWMLFEELLDAFGIAKVGLQGYEADDIIGTLAEHASSHELKVTVITGDKDALQLISPTVKVLLTKKGISELELFDEAAFFQRYGIRPSQFVDVKSLMGDSSDNIPGVSGIGEKTALKLIQQFGSLDSLLANIEQVNGKKTQELLRSQSEQAKLSQQLAAIVRDAPVEYIPTEYQWRPNFEQVKSLFTKLEFKGLLNRLQLLLPESESIVAVNATLPVPQAACNAADLQAVLAGIHECGLTFWPLYSGDGTCNTLSGLAIALAERELFFTPLDLGWSEVVALLNSPVVIKATHDAKQIAPLCNDTGNILCPLVFDSLLAAYLLEPAATDYSLPRLAATYLGQEVAWDPVKLRHDPGFAVWSAKTIRELQPVLTNKLVDTGLMDLYQTIELPLVSVLATMETTGVAIDTSKLDSITIELAGKIESLLIAIYDAAGESFNVNSTKQLAAILYEKLGLPVLKKTKTGYSTDAEVLEKLSGQHAIIDNLLEYRMLAKLKSTYLDGLKTLISKTTGRIHTTFNQTVTTTGRLSSSDPNLQNIPVRTDIGRRIRELFVPGERWQYILSADYSQIELRVLAHMSGDHNLIDAFKQGHDVHTRTAAEVFNVPLSEVTPLLRSRAKAVNFGIVYGISDYGLSRDIGVSRKEAEVYIANYFDRYPGVKAFMDESIAIARQCGFVTTLFGRRRFLPDIHATNFSQRSFAERTAMNTPIQGTAADIIKRAMVDIYERLCNGGYDSRILLQVHDELLFEVTATELDDISNLVRDSMENAAQLAVPLVVDLNYGENWAKAK